MDSLNVCSFNPREFIQEWISQISHENNTLLNRLQLEFECLEEDDSKNRESFCCGHLDDVEKITITNEKVDDDILAYFPEEIAELAPQVRRYFMGKQDGYTTTEVI